MMAVLSVCHGSNADLIAAACDLYLHGDAMVADVTFGKGVFWKAVNPDSITLYGSDMFTIPPAQGTLFPGINLIRADFRRLPYADGTFDIAVFDPPYTHNPGNHMTDKRYRLADTTRGHYHRDIMRLYFEGMDECRRIIKTSGQLWVKCKDEVESSVQQWSHIEVFEIGKKIGLYARDLFVLIPTARTSHNRWTRQFHARKVHSYLWVFTAPPKQGGVNARTQSPSIRPG